MKKYLVALEEGGLMEEPNITYSAYQLIEAESEEEAEAIYNRKNECSYFYGTCLGEYDENTGKVLLPLSIFIKEKNWNLKGVIEMLLLCYFIL